MWRGRAGTLPAAIGALCRALPPVSRPAPETFRLAKFDRPEASLQIWRLLYSLLKQIHDGGWTEPDTIGGSCVEDDERNMSEHAGSSGTQIRFVKSVLRYHGYGRPEFYQLPSDGSQGSRELLLAFSWLLNRISLLERLLTVNRVKIGDEASVCTCEDNLSNSWKDRTEIALEPCLKREVDVRYLQWLTGRLRFQWRSLHVDHQEQCKLLHKIHSYTSGCHMDQTIGHFSVTETDLIRQPDSYKQLLQSLESETSRLEAFLEWKRLEPVYWHWMETVLDTLDEDANTFKSEDVCKEKNTLPNANLCCHSASNIIGEIDKLTKDLVTLHDGLHELVNCKKSAWYEKQVTMGDITLMRISESDRERMLRESLQRPGPYAALLCRAMIPEYLIVSWRGNVSYFGGPNKAALPRNLMQRLSNYLQESFIEMSQEDYCSIPGHIDRILL
ncbi:tubulin epsilon and delta complex protein 1 isoform X5 [Chrysemys picta bellii]|uniref:tubulin epsilon and delta complex protein 1 isoform X5 n=1 Tax=Chrysemys picta bellii TaxID=8478 RepID=UPI0032B258EB